MQRVYSIQDKAHEQIEHIFDITVSKICESVQGSSIRRSPHYQMPGSNGGPQNVIWPKNPCFDNPIVGVITSKTQNLCRYNFVLRSGQKTNYDLYARGHDL